MRISDWSSDVCSSDLRLAPDIGYRPGYTSRWTKAIDQAAQRGEAGTVVLLAAVGTQGQDWRQRPPEHLLHIVSALRQVGLELEADRKRVREGKRVSVRVDVGGRRDIHKK